MNRISHVLFDLGNVLVTIHPERFSATLGTDHARKEMRRSLVLRLIHRYEQGEIDSDTFFRNLDKIFEGKYAREKLTEAMESVIGQAVTGMPELLERVSSSVPVALASNTNETHFAYCRRQFRFLSLIPRFFLSWEMKTLKPAPEYYARVLDTVRAPAHTIAFIDDLPENVEGARKAGMVGIVFEGAARLENALQDLGVVSRAD
ncbi:MAG: haloacid dehalogenase [Bacteroidia bacterium]|nr:MAG: haloacid dehalogenase [Bacteroidia bacterium]